MSEYKSLTLKYRPQTLDDVSGQDNVIKMLKNAVELNRVNHVILFIGPAGTGKTSTARIWSKMMNCKSDNPPCCECPTCKAIAEGKSQDVLELNAADKRKIDDIRDVLSKIRFKPMSKYKIVILDECFYKDTLITMSDNSKKKISEINIGDKIKNTNGIDTVKKVIANKVPLERLVLLKLNNGNEILTTLDHKFYTEHGWVECHNLKVGDLLYDKNMLNMWDSVSNVGQKSEDLFKGMWVYSEKRNNENKTHYSKVAQSKNNVQSMQKDIFGVPLCEKKWYEILFRQMCENWKNWTCNIRRNKKENIRISKVVESNKRRKTSSTTKFDSYETKQSNDVSREYRQSNSNKNEKWNSWLAGYKRWKWSIHRPTMESMCSFNSCNKDRSSFGICNKFRKIKERLSNKLQSRLSLSESKTCNRSRWGIPQYGMGQSKGFKETKNVEQIRVESLTFYKQGDRREYFTRYISDKERTCGYIEMYDLTIQEQHNYIANDVLVHNCHMLSVEAFNALLKDLEEPPEYCIFILCTTNPEKIPETILSRCQTFELKSVQIEDVVKRLEYICDEEGFTYDEKALELIAKEKHGGMRDSVSALEQIACFSNDDINLSYTSDFLGVIDETQFNDLIKSLANHDIDSAIDILNELILKDKSIDKIFYQLQDTYGTMLKEYFRSKSENIYSKHELLSICKLVMDYENKLKYASDKYYIMVNLFNDICYQLADDINVRLEKLEAMIKNGNFKQGGSIDIERANRINRALYSKKEPKVESANAKQADEEIVDALSFIRS